MLLDSNIIIYSALPEYEFLREFIRNNSPFVSDISRVEVLGFRKLSGEDIEYFETFFRINNNYSCFGRSDRRSHPTSQQRKMALGDSLVAASAIVNNFSLVTNNTKDFKWMNSLVQLTL